MGSLPSTGTNFMPTWLNWIEHHTTDVRVGGSNPLVGAINFIADWRNWVAQGFLVPWVVGSNPTSAAN